MRTRCCRVWVLVLLSLTGPLSNAHTRPKYSEIFAETFEAEYAGKNVTTDSCSVYHKRDKNKRAVSNFGEAIKGLLQPKKTTV